MLKIQSPSQVAGFEPAPRIASDAEIALAEELRHQLEERYFGRVSVPALSSAGPDNDHGSDQRGRLPSKSSR